ncbi:MAG: hypothetical protein HUU57_00295 [Bdellovibrio sp.]|nr:hypothetical protein [Bdellovibrio sp.]
MKNWMSLATGVATLSMLTACSGGGSDSSTQAPSLTTGVTAVSMQAMGSALKSAGGLVPNTLGASLTSKLLKGTGIHTMAISDAEAVWSDTTTKLVNDPRCSGGDAPHCSTGNVTVPQYVGFMSDPAAARDNGSWISVFGRIKQATGLSCALGVLVSAENGGTIPKSGSFSVTFSQSHADALETVCDMDISDKVGATLVAEFEPVTSDYYDSLVTISINSEAQVGVKTWLRVTETEVNVAAAETNDDDDNGQDENTARTIVKFNKETGVLKAEYLSYHDDDKTDSKSGSNGGEFHRIYVDQTNKIAVMFGGNVGTTADGFISPILLLAGQPNTPTANTAFSYIMGGGAPLSTLVPAASTATTAYNFEGCVKQSDSTWVSTNYSSCVTGLSLTKTGADIVSLIAPLRVIADKTSVWSGVTGVVNKDFTVDFDTTTIFTQEIDVTP